MKRLFIVAGESSGDALGAAVVRALRASNPELQIVGVGGPQLAGLGLNGLFPMSDIAVMGIGPVLRRLPLILRRIRETIDAAVNSGADAILLIDSPDFCHRVGRAVRKRAPQIRTIAYVSPTVWAWRPGRAAKMAEWCDHLLALLPFEPEAHRRLNGPPTTYVGHPLVARLAELRPSSGLPRLLPDAGQPVRLLVLPGSRRSEVGRLLAPFGEAVGMLHTALPQLQVLLPTVEHVRAEIEQGTAHWAVKPAILRGEAAKLEALRLADAALAASGTVTLELALAGIPTVAAYKLDWIARRAVPFLGVPAALKGLINVRTPILPNIIADRIAIPALIDDAASPAALAAEVTKLMSDSQERREQLALFAEVERRMSLPGDKDPATAAADAIKWQTQSHHLTPTA